ncbi:unnamed protein product [Ectocarpus sp. 12 AP-2014]
MDSDGDAAMANGGGGASANDENCASLESTVPEHCEECEDRRPVWDCKQGCGGVFCDVCFYALHRKGKRALHKPEKIERPGAATGNCGPAAGKGLSGWIGPRLPPRKEEAHPDMYDRKSFSERSKYIPVRLTSDERRYLRLVESVISVTDYTGKVDADFPSASKRSHLILKQITRFLSGLVLAVDYQKGMTMIDERGYSEHEGFFQDVLEIARRHKIMNPEKMRTEYAKLIYLMQDAVSPEAQRILNLNIKRGVKSVYEFLRERGGLAILSDPNVEIATREVLANGRPRPQITKDIRRKEAAVAQIKRKYATHNLSQDDIHTCLYSMCDNDSFLNSNRVPIDKMIAFLEKYFSPDTPGDDAYSLAISAGEGGARLTHSHARQYNFAHQARLASLTLWRDIMHDMFRLWCLGEEDLLSESFAYKLVDTGQGKQRVQNSPQTFKAMQEILFHAQHGVQSWVGSSVIHLGDHNVPNALMFIDKYTQVSRILGPIVSCLEQLVVLYDKDEHIQNLIDTGYGGLETLRKDILFDFFRSAFDGSGADNFFDAGSCIDGRLTSAWNWCSQLNSKPFFPMFQLTGFTSFDGEFQR